ncbi:hypothetical protein [Sphingomicrobium nitratireducens]|uniref:hypothetical protein n=1 Tax=Sphingomicrobium nitratireducens TaxID=2964666 RepID=UPI002240827A|nr:hypothetical protein [Sphingomicrobium nitratireducens]
MRLDRAEWAGTATSVAFHVALVAALSLSLAHVARPPEPPAIAVEFVDEIGLESRAAVQESALAKQAMSPEPEDVAEPIPDEVPPPPKVEPTPAPPRERVKPTPTPRTEQPRRQNTRRSRLGDDFLDGISEGNSRTGQAETGQAAAPVIDAAAMASIQQAIRRQVQPCADLQQNPGPGANRIRVTLNLRLAPDGRLSSRPRVVSVSGVDGENERYEDRVKDLAIATYVGCAPLTGLPSELYKTSQGGWSNINMTYRLP